MENSPSSPSQNAFHKRRPFQIGIGLFVCAILIGAIVIGIWLITKPSSSGGGSGPNSTTIAPTTSPTSPTSTAGNESSSSTTTRPMPPQRDVKVHLNLFNTSILHVWLKAKEKGKEAVLYANFLSSASHDPLFSTKDTEWFDFFQMESKGRTGIVEFSWSNSTTILSYMYAYEPENVKTQGIRPAYICDQAKGPNAPQSFHLRPPLGWQNDPNGFSRANDGVYHLFYQHYPHSTARGPMYWGHATSNDLVNWAHQPIFLRAEDKKCGDKCGWFSGSAVPNDEHGHGGLQIFLTDHNRTRAIREIQSSIPTYDTILPSTNPVVIIGEEPKNPRPDLKLTEDFRDPNVFLGPNGYFYMTLGSKDSLGKGGVIMLYRTKEKKLNSEWIFQNVILTDNSLGTEVCECSGMVPLGDPNNGYTYYALLYARMTSIDADGRKNLSPIILGTFDGTTFKRIGEQELDFAAGSYGFQAFYDPIGHETLLIGWLANWPDWDQHSEFPSTMTLPRVLKRSGNIILQGPHPNVVRQLRGMELDGKALLRGNTVLLPNGTAYIQLGINYNYFFNGIFIRINHPDYLQLGVRITYIGMEIVKVQKGDEPNRRYMASNAQPDIVHIFIDRDSLEVFGEKKMDGGMSRWAGTTRLTGNGKFFVDSVQLETTDRYNYVMDNCKIWEMKSAHLKGHIWG